jgi:hypothetical protein
MALSNPNFELWLLLHLKDLADYSQEQLDDILNNKKINASKNILELELSSLLEGYNKSKYAVEKFLPFIQTAIERAQAFDINPEDRWIEGKLGTRMYRLAESILGK